MVSPASEDPRRIEEFPAQLLDALAGAGRARPPAARHRHRGRRCATRRWWPSRWAARPTSCCTAPELARAAGIDFWHEVISQEEFNQVSRTLPVLVNARPFGRYSMVDIDAKGGLPVIVARAARRRAARRRLHHLHRRDAGRAGRPARPARARRRRHPSAVGAVQADRRPADAPRQPGARRRRRDQARRRRGRHAGRPVHRPRPGLRRRAGADRGAGARRRSGSRTATWW